MAEFMAALLTGERAGLAVTVACTEVRDRWGIYRRILDETAPPIWLETFDLIADALVVRLAGWNRWEAEHVWMQSLGAWNTVDGDLRLSGVELHELSFGAATNTLFAWWRRTLGGSEDTWKSWIRDMTREPRRVILAEADQPMDMEAYATLTGNIARARSGNSDTVTAPDSAVIMPEQDTLT